MILARLDLLVAFVAELFCGKHKEWGKMYWIRQIENFVRMGEGGLWLAFALFEKCQHKF